jgi:hypothetical protein
VWTALDDCPPVGSQQQIGEFQGVFDKPHLVIDPLDRRGSLPGTLLVTPILRVSQGRTISVMEAWTVDGAPLLDK